MESLQIHRSSSKSVTGDTLQLHAQSTGEGSDGLFSTSDESYYVDSTCSTPYVSAPSSPGRSFDAGGGGGGGYYYSAPSSPMHFILSSATMKSSQAETSETGPSGSFEFEFGRIAASCDDEAAAEIGAMSSADELFLNGQIRPMKLFTHLQRPQNVDCCEETGESNMKDLDRDGEDVFRRPRDLRLRDKSIRRRTRSMSPLRNTTPFNWCEPAVKAEEEQLAEHAELPLDEKIGTPSASASSSRCSSAGRSSRRWIFLKDFLRSKSEGRSSHKFWTNISFPPTKEKKPPTNIPKEKSDKEQAKKSPAPAPKPTSGVGKRRVPLSAHELHYTANRAQAEEMRKKTFLPYRQGLLGCLGFSSKSYGAMNGFARALNPVSSR